jgi:hypothetical protein
MTARKGLRRIGLRAYVVSGPKGRVVIERERRGHFLVRPEKLPRAFNYGDYRLLREAVAYAGQLAGDLAALLPPFLDRRERRGS